MKNVCKKLCLVFFVLALVASAAWAGGGLWTAGGGSNLWETPANWQSGVPTASDSAYVTHDFTVSYAPVINTGVNAVAGQVIVGWAAISSGDTSLTINGGSLATPELYVGLGGTNANHGTVNMSAGNVTTTGSLILGWQGGMGTLNMSGGTINVGTFWLTPDAGSYAELNLLDGLLNITGGFGWVDAQYHVEIQKGTMLIAGDYAGVIGYWASQGWWTGYGNPANIVASYDSGSNVTTVTAIPEPATIALLSLGGLALLRRNRKS